MRRVAWGFVAGLFISCSLVARATEVFGDQSGTWDLGGSPYALIGDVRVPPGEVLVIEPGVVVIGMGNFKILVDGGTLLAVGTEDAPILMTADNQNVGWRGLQLFGASDDSRISHCVIEYAKGTGAYPQVRGGAIYVKECSPVISHNELRFNLSQNGNRNGVGGGVLTETSDAWIHHNHIHDNAADSGGGVCTTESGTPIVEDNLIIDNRAFNGGGGIYAGARSSPLIERNVIAGNNSGGWGGGGLNMWTAHVFYQTYGTVRDNLIVDNATSVAGGGVYARYDGTVLVGNTIAGNRAGSGGGIYVLNQGSSEPSLTNSILWGNTASQGPAVFLEPSTGSIVSIRYSDVEGGYTGQGNTDQPPRFVGGDPFDYHLEHDSPCRDAGDPSYRPVEGETDIDGESRVIGGRVDMGADEYLLLGDSNRDGVVDLLDFVAFFACMKNGPGEDPPDPECAVMDFERDGDVDLGDYTGFQIALAESSP
jgi:parallel beta-helix repeat protein